MSVCNLFFLTLKHSNHLKQGDSRVFQERFKSASGVCQECVKGVSKVFQGFFKGVSGVIQGCFKGV